MSPMEKLVRDCREELFDATQRLHGNEESDLVIKSRNIINEYKKRKFDVITERLISDARAAELEAKLLSSDDATTIQPGLAASSTGGSESGRTNGVSG